MSCVRKSYRLLAWFTFCLLSIFVFLTPAYAAYFEVYNNASSNYVLKLTGSSSDWYGVTPQFEQGIAINARQINGTKGQSSLHFGDSTGHDTGKTIHFSMIPTDSGAGYSSGSITVEVTRIVSFKQGFSYKTHYGSSGIYTLQQSTNLPQIGLVHQPAPLSQQPLDGSVTPIDICIPNRQGQYLPHSPCSDSDSDIQTSLSAPFISCPGGDDCFAINTHVIEYDRPTYFAFQHYGQLVLHNFSNNFMDIHIHENTNKYLQLTAPNEQLPPDDKSMDWCFVTPGSHDSVSTFLPPNATCRILTEATSGNTFTHGGETTLTIHRNDLAHDDYMTLWTHKLLFAAGVIHSLTSATSGSNDVNNIAVWNGTYWSRLGEGLTNSDPNQRAEIDTLAMNHNELFAGGRFNTAPAQQGEAFDSVARWNDRQGFWQPIGKLTHGQNEAARINVLAADHGVLYAGGAFSSGVASSQLNNVAWWNGQNWQPLGNGLSTISDSGAVNALAFDSAGNVYAGGTFEESSGVSGLNNVAEFNSGAVNADSGSWQQLSAGLQESLADSGTVNALAYTSGSLYAAGHFNISGSTQHLHNLARYTVSSGWTGLPLGLANANSGGTLYALTTDTSGDVFIGGRLFQQGTNQLVTQWNGQKWVSGFPPPMGGDSRVDDALTYAENKLYAGGTFAHGTHYRNLAYWQPKSIVWQGGFAGGLGLLDKDSVHAIVVAPVVVAHCYGLDC